MARELEGNWTRFTPHYIVWVCPESYRSSDECQSQCIHNGRYCTPDPDGDLQAGYSGRDIVQVRKPIGCALHAGLYAALQQHAPCSGCAMPNRFLSACPLSTCLALARDHMAVCSKA